MTMVVLRTLAFAAACAAAGATAQVADSAPAAALRHSVNDCDIRPGTLCNRTDLSGADLAGCDLAYASFAQSDLSGANLNNADLHSANLRDANLRRADLRDALLYDIDLEQADLRGADLRGANLVDAFLEDADLRGADLRGADLRGARLWGAQLNDARLDGAKLQRASLRAANLAGATFDGADLRGTRFEDASLAGANLRGARIDASTELARRCRGLYRLSAGCGTEALILLCHESLVPFSCPQYGHSLIRSMSPKPRRCRSDGIESATWRCARRTAAGDVIRGNGRHLAFDEVFFAADAAAGSEALGHQESVRRNT
jgi:uncharacterized protein YjbI with pentapeptide repeats